MWEIKNRIINVIKKVGYSKWIQDRQTLGQKVITTERQTDTRTESNNMPERQTDIQKHERKVIIHARKTERQKEILIKSESITQGVRTTQSVDVTPRQITMAFIRIVHQASDMTHGDSNITHDYTLFLQLITTSCQQPCQNLSVPHCRAAETSQNLML